MLYHIVQEPSLEELKRVVNRMIDDEWEPQGGVAVYEKSDELTLFIQVVIR